MHTCFYCRTKSKFYRAATENFGTLMSIMVIFFVVIGVSSWLALQQPKGVVNIEPLQQVSIDLLPPSNPPINQPAKPAVKVIMPAKPVIPPVSLNLPSVKPFKVSTIIKLDKKEFDCLAKNIYYESRGEPKLGKIAVAQITHNRVKSGRWGKKFCDVVYARKQFSWTNDLSHMQIPHGQDWQQSQAAALDYARGTRVTRLKQANHYHARYVNPQWANTMKPKARVGAHIFYADAK